jgi:two-component system chemotaxis response regulator CheY
MGIAHNRSIGQRRQVMFKLSDDLVFEYLAEASDQLATMEADLLAMEEAGAEIDEEQVNRIFRAVHSIKGGAGFFDLAKIGELAHHAEDVLALIRSRKIAPTPDVVRVLLRTTDRLNELVKCPDTSNEADIADLIAELAGLRADRRAPDQKNCAPVTGQALPVRAALRVLIVEDDFTSRLLLQTFLSRYGECHIAVNGKEAVEAFQMASASGSPYNLICMDIMMPEMDGKEAVKQVRALEEERGVLSTKGVKIIMTTALTDPKDVFQSFRELCDFYLFKPINMSKLLDHLKALQLV